MPSSRKQAVRRMVIGLMAIVLALCLHRVATGGDERILIGDYHGARVIEIDRAGTVYFEYCNRYGVQDVEYLPNGNFLITGANWNTIEVDRGGNIVKQWYGTETANTGRLLSNGNLLVGEWYYKRVREIDTSVNPDWEYCGAGNITALGSVERLLNGNTLISFEENSGDALDSTVVEVDTEGIVVWEYDAGYFFLPSEAERLPNGNTLITDASDVIGYERGVFEVDCDGAIVWQLDTGLRLPMAAHRLCNGNTLIADTYNSRVIEVDPDKSIVWEYSADELETPWDVEYKECGECEGNFDDDGDIDGSDLAVFPDLSAGKDPLADLNYDDTVDTKDLAIFSAEFGRINCL